MTLAILAILGGFILLVWSADRFVEGAAVTAKHAGMPSLLIGMVIVGFGTSAPEMVVSAMAAIDGNPDLALGNALGSNIVNTGLILGVTAVITPIMVQSKIVRKEIPLLLLIGLLLGYFLLDGALTRVEAVLLLVGFFTLIGWSIFSAIKSKGDKLETEMDQELVDHAMPLKKAIFWLVLGLVLLIVSSRVLVWGAVNIAHAFGVSDLIIGLTIVALGTSLPELAASVIAVRKGEHDIAIGNVVGSNMFNLLAVVGIAGVISPMSSLPEQVLSRDWLVMMSMTVALLIIAYGFRRAGRINRYEGVGLLIAFCAYNVWLVSSVIA
ncbi:calcium/sodium antiporter [Shewanella frigidimarina]|jgi:cation:H+ antiporter|uniref:Calcium/sodium antiporter n=2 Tax=Shewanella TaxID=22 RepID=A0A9X1Z972_9GAMM|nr:MULTISPECIES: calcium/sodium antiporter [Shewanella]MBB1390945.1 calcium/sodium antiporter [Shewanella sp. SG44-6]MCL1107659.1 calcium/sodium antiporter [Shewanella algicola]PIX70650.1 MAG: calcium/sodium antiporter [Shewanella sp. CG_4_10_14_3_um_filter_42_91]PIY63828.1 MAG: calcium/sodium antiporter [Shewanella sp. CG_4_10_14_0_8_um_filter_42_13]RPA50843.1 calcium/sodium antiporter [Shewanella vesiculosa]|tara:strand:- start:58683 stop:59654 length:972 start_codon:yes stop_codon:yes gene_type:complete